MLDSNACAINKQGNREEGKEKSVLCRRNSLDNLCAAETGLSKEKTGGQVLMPQEFRVVIW